MGITINISEGAGAMPASPGAGMGAGHLSIDAGTSGGLAAAGQGAMGPATLPGQRFDGGAPSPALVQEVEAALNRIGASAMATPGGGDSVNAGAAPV